LEVDTELSARARTFILAGGRGDRLFPLTADRPKPTVPFGGVFRIVDFTLLNCRYSGLTGLRLLTQHNHEQVHQYVSQNWGQHCGWRQNENDFKCLPPAKGKVYRGTADAVFQNLMNEEPLPEFVLILSADHIYRMDYRQMLRIHAATGAGLTIGTVERPLEEASRYGVVSLAENSRVVRFEEKPGRPQPLPGNPRAAQVSMGIYAFRTDCLRQALLEDAECVSSQHDFGRDIIPKLVEYGEVVSYDFRDPVEQTTLYWRDIGTVDAYYESSMDLVCPYPPFDPFHTTEWPMLSLGACVRGGRVRNSVLSAGVRIEERAEVENSVLLQGVRVGAGARIRRAIIQENVHVPAGARIGFNPESDRGRYFVTPTGISVVGNLTEETRPIFSRNHIAPLVPVSSRLEFDSRRFRRARAT